jgi:hypothetical protein
VSDIFIRGQQHKKQKGFEDEVRESDENQIEIEPISSFMRLWFDEEVIP